MTHFLGGLTETPVRQDCVVEDEVRCQPVSIPNSLVTGKLTGNLGNLPPADGFCHLIDEPKQWLAAKFPAHRNREFLKVQEGIFDEEQGYFHAEFRRPPGTFSMLWG
jgi:hypothetical protein